MRRFQGLTPPAIYENAPSGLMFTSVLREDFEQDSDVDVLVEFELDAKVGYFRLYDMEQELSAMLERKVDLSTPNSLSKYFRDAVLEEAEVQYVAA